MGWYRSSRKYRTVRLDNYDHAKWVEGTITPIRGRSVKPLGDRRRQHENIRMVGDDVVVQFHHTDVLTLKPTGEWIIDLGGYHTVTTYDFLNRVLPNSLRVGSRYGHTILLCSVWDEEKQVYKHGAFMFEGSRVVIRKGCPTQGAYSASHWELLEGFTPCVVHNVNRKAMNAKRRHLKPFIDYVLGMGSLVRWGVTHTNWGYRASFSMTPTERRDVEDLLEHLLEEPEVRLPEQQDEMDEWARVAKRIIQGYSSADAFIRALTNMVAHIAPHEVLVRHELPMGTVQKDNYASCVRGVYV